MLPVAALKNQILQRQPTLHFQVSNFSTVKMTQAFSPYSLWFWGEGMLGRFPRRFNKKPESSHLVHA